MSFYPKLLKITLSLLSIFLLSSPRAFSMLITRTAVGQLRIEAAGLFEPEPPQSPPPVYSPPVPSPPSPISIQPPNPQIDSSTDTLSLLLEKIPSDRIGVFYASGPINAQNPLLILNSQTGGMTAIYQEDSGHYHIHIGTVPNKNNGLSTKSIPESERFQIEKSDYMQSASLVTYQDPPSENLSLSGSDSSLTLDTYPRKDKRYARVSLPFKADGAWIPQYAIVVATKDYDLKTGRPDKNSEFQDYRVYDPETGALIYQFKPKDIDADKFKKLDFNYSPAGTSLYGAQIYQSFSTADLFPRLSPEEAGRNWIAIQSDLAANVQLDINSRKHEWQERIFRELDKAEFAYIQNTLSYEGIDAAKSLVFGQRTFIDDKARELDDAQFLALLAWVELREDLRYLEDLDKRRGLSGEQSDSLSIARKVEKERYKNYEDARKSYDDYILEAQRAKERPEAQIKTYSSLAEGIAQGIIKVSYLPKSPSPEENTAKPEPKNNTNKKPSNSNDTNKNNTDKKNSNTKNSNKNKSNKKPTNKKTTEMNLIELMMR
jgi:hypothetical protein